MEIALCTQNTIRSILYSRVAAKELRLSKRWWWHRALWWLCVRLGLTFDRPVEHETITRIRIDEPTLGQLIGRNQRDLKLIWNRQARYVIIAGKTADDLFGEVASRDFYSFNWNMKMHSGQCIEYRGLKIVIVPWIERGLFLLPELEN